MTNLPLAARYLLDVQHEFLRAVDNVPAPGRGGPLGRMNTVGWVVAHVAFVHDLWINVQVGGREPHPWAAQWRETQSLTPPLAEARAAYLEVVERAAEVVGSLDAAGMNREVQLSRGPVAAGYLIARSPSHILTHAGELNVIGALVTAPELDLPGALLRTTGEPVGATSEVQPNLDIPPLAARLLLDALDAFARTVEAHPAPAAAGAIERVHPGASTIAEVANHIARLWNVEAEHLAPDAWSGAALTQRVPRADAPTFEDARAAYSRAVAGIAPYLESLRVDDLARPLGESTVGATAMRTTALLCARMGELNALASLFEAPDLGLPGSLPRTAER